jgi:myo-inositol-1(or 4)-monophosphatase
MPTHYQPGGVQPGSYGVEAEIERMADELAGRLREVVLPRLGTQAARGLVGHAAGGDTTFAIDEEAERFVESFLSEAKVPVAVYSEDRGLVEWGESTHVFIIDPIDGTRPAVAGFEAACVSVAVAVRSEHPCMGNVVYAVLKEIKEGGVFRARRGAGAEAFFADGSSRPFRVSSNTDLSRLFWTIGFRGRPAAELVRALGHLIDLSSVDGGVFDLGSATYSMTRLLTGQLDAYIDVGPLMIEVAPWVEERFREVGRGHVLNNSPYDVAASTLILEEAGCVVTDAAGRPLDDRPLLGSDVEHQMSVVASASAVLHERILDMVETGMQRLAAGPR